MRIEIEIPKEFEVDYAGDKFKDFFSRVLCDIKEGKCLCGNYEIETAEMFIKAFDESKPAYDVEKAKTPTPTHPIPLDTQMYIQELENRFERIAKELEEYKYSHLVEVDIEDIKHCEGVDDCVNGDCLLCVFDKAIEIVKGGVDNAG